MNDKQADILMNKAITLIRYEIMKDELTRQPEVSTEKIDAQALSILGLMVSSLQVNMAKQQGLDRDFIYEQLNFSGSGVTFVDSFEKELEELKNRILSLEAENKELKWILEGLNK